MQLLRIATVITPAMLTVNHFALTPAPHMLDLPSVAFASANMFIATTNASENATLQYEDSRLYTSSYECHGPSDAVNAISVAVGALGATLPVKAPAQNSSWDVTFSEPSIMCHNGSDAVKSAIVFDIARHHNESMSYYNLRQDSPFTSSVFSALDHLYFAGTPLVPSRDVSYYF